MYRVIQAFCDLEDAVETKSGPVYHEYREGDEYPRLGRTASEERISELMGYENRQKKPLIEPVLQVSEQAARETETESAAKKPASGKREKKK